MPDSSPPAFSAPSPPRAPQDAAPDTDARGPQAGDPHSLGPPTGEPGAPHPHALRADARRNRAAILEAAEAVFSSAGPGAPIDEVARRAGVGVGTLYRHFPTKEDLLGALVAAHAEPLVEAAQDALRARDPGPALFGLIRHLAIQFVRFRALADAIAAAGIDLQSSKAAHSDQLMAVFAEVLARAQRAGAVRGDVTASDVTTVMGALCHAQAVSRDPSSLSRYVDLLCDGLRASPARRRTTAASGTPPPS